MVKSMDFEFNLFDFSSALPFTIFVTLGKLFIYSLCISVSSFLKCG